MTKLTITLLVCSFYFSKPATAQDRREDSSAPGIINPAYSLAVMPVFILKERIGVGLCYEYFLGGGRRMSLSFPLFYSFPYPGREPEFHHDEHYRFLEAPQNKDLHYQKDDGNGLVYFNPGIKVYPGVNKGRLKYGLGVSLVFNTGTIVRHVKDYEIRPIWQGRGGYREYERTLLRDNIATLSVFRMGAMLTNSLYYYTDKHLFLAGEIGMGCGLYSKLDNYNAPNEPIVQGALKVGYAW